MMCISVILFAGGVSSIFAQLVVWIDQVKDKIS